MDAERPRKVYQLTNEGETILNFTEGSLSLICKTMATDNKIKMEAAPLSASVARFQKKNQGIAAL